MDNIIHIRELFDEKLKPIVQSIIELRQELKDMNYTALTLKVESLEKSKEYYKVEYFNTVKRLDLLEQRINKIDNSVEEVGKLSGIERGLEKLSLKVEALESTMEKHELLDSGNLLNVKQDVEGLKKELSIFLLINKYPRMSTLIIVGLIALMTSDKIINIINYLKNMF